MKNVHNHEICRQVASGKVQFFTLYEDEQVKTSKKLSQPKYNCYAKIYTT